MEIDWQSDRSSAVVADPRRLIHRRVKAGTAEAGMAEVGLQRKSPGHSQMYGNGQPV